MGEIFFFLCLEHGMTNSQTFQNHEETKSNKRTFHFTPRCTGKKAETTMVNRRNRTRQYFRAGPDGLRIRRLWRPTPPQPSAAETGVINIPYHSSSFLIYPLNQNAKSAFSKTRIYI